MAIKERIHGAGPFGKALDLDELLGRGTDARRRFEQRFWSRVEVKAEDECWPWLGKTEKNGYGRISITTRPYTRTHQFSHRIAFVLRYGALNDGECSLHECDNRPCCNPKHLYRGTQQANIKDRDERGRTHRGPNPKLSAAIKGRPNKAIRKLTPEAVVWARQQVGEGRRSVRSLARELGVHHRALGNAIKGRTYQEVR